MPMTTKGDATSAKNAVTSWPDDSRCVIVIGCHRSGASLLAGLLQQLGAHLGSDCGTLVESRFFTGLNVELLRVTGATWYRPAQAILAARHDTRRAALIARLRRALRSPARTRYLGRPAGHRRPPAFDAPAWGWKDPRTTLTLPAWLSLFPAARVIHVVRHGVDVAQSLIVRERAAPRVKLRVLRRAVHRVGAGLALVDASDGWEQQRPFFDTPEDAFRIWTEYVWCANDVTAALSPRQVLVQRYEDLIEQPARAIERVSGFLDLTLPAARTPSLAATILPSRRFAFVGSADLRDFSRRVQHHPLMRQFGYDQLPSRMVAPGS